LAVGRRVGNLWSQAFNGYPLGVVLLDMGRVSEGLREMWTAADSALQGGFHGPAAIISVVLRWELGMLGASHHQFERLRALFAADTEYATTNQFWLAFEHYFAGDAAEAFDRASQVELPPLISSGYEGIFMPLVLARLAVTAGKPVEALAIVNHLVAELDGLGLHAAIPSLLTVRGDALRVLGRRDEARAAWGTALVEARQQGARRGEWPALAALSDAEPDPAAAADYRRQAVEVIRYLESNIDEPDLRKAFLNLPDVRRILSAG
jgi:hypothetical protein